MGDDSGLPGSGRHEGKQAAIDVLQEALGAYDKYELTAEEFFEQGDTFVVLGHQEGAKGDRSVRLLFVRIWRFRGEQVGSVQFLNDTLTTARLLGLARPRPGRTKRTGRRLPAAHRGSAARGCNPGGHSVGSSADRPLQLQQHDGRLKSLT